MKVTSFVKYDLFPYYIVLEGELQEDSSVKTGCGTYPSKNVLQTKPFSEINYHKVVIDNLKKDYRRFEHQLKIDLLKEYAIDFINKEEF